MESLVAPRPHVAHFQVQPAKPALDTIVVEDAISGSTILG